MKKALSIILALVMMFTLLPTAFADNTIDVKAGTETISKGDGNWTFTDGVINIENADITEVSITGDPNVSLSFAVSPKYCFTVKTSIEGLTIKPAVNMPNGLRIIKNADYPVTIQFDPNQDTAIGNGLFIMPDGTNLTSITSEDSFVTNGRTVSISLTASSGATTLDYAMAAINTTGSLQFKQNGSVPSTFAITTNVPETTLGDEHICAVNASNLKVSNGVTLTTSVAKSKDTANIYNAVQTKYLDVSKGAAVQATVTGGADTHNTTAVFATTLNNNGTVKASVGSGNAAVYAGYLNFKDGAIEATNPNGNAVAFPVILNVEENAKAIGGDDAGHATEIEDLENSNSYNGKKYVKLYIPSDLSLDKSTISIAVGQTSTLTATTVPATATIASWTPTTSEFIELTPSADQKTCTVSAKKATTTPITVTVTDDAGHTATCAVTVTEAPAGEIELNRTTINLTAGSTFKLIPTKLVPSDTTVTWTVNEEARGSVEVGTDGTVTAKAVTSNPATVTATTREGITATCQVNVVSPSATLVDIYDPAAELYSLGSVGEVVRFRASVTPEWTAENNNDIRWTSSNENVAKVTAIEPHGKGAYIEATGAGSAAITASCGGRADVVSVVVVSDYKFTAPTGKLIWYYDRNPQYNLEFSTSIPYQGIRRVVIQAGNRDYDFTSVAMQNTYGTVTIPYSALYTTFGRQTTTMTVKVFYGPGANDYIYKNLYYRSVYDAPLTADTDMTWAYVTMLVAGLFISASPLILKKAKRRGAAQ